MDEERTAEDARFRCLVESTSDSYVVYDATGSILDVNAATCEVSGHERGRLLGMQVNQLVEPEEPASLTEVDQLFCEGRPAVLQVTLRCADGNGVRGELRVGALEDADGSSRFLGLVRDVSELERRGKELDYLSDHDSLTGLLNCSSFTRHAEEAVERGKSRRSSLAVLHLDLDRFSLINQALGHATGDELLRQVGSRLRAAVRPMDLIARYSADEFLVLLADHPGEGPEGELSGSEAVRAAEECAVRIHRGFEPPFSVDGTELYVDASVGISVFPLDADEVSVLLRHSEAAAQQAKRPGRSATEIFAEETSDKWARLSLATRLRKAVEREELVLHYQPIVDLEQQAVTAVEALVRWRDRDGSLIPPGTFVPLAEDVGLIDAIGDWVVEESARQAGRWRSGGVDVDVSVNVSLRQLWTPGLVERMTELIDAQRVNPSGFIVELTETAAMTDPVRTQAVLREMRASGFQLAIDDFGAGHSSLTRLWQMPAQMLKIDRSFVCRLPDDTNVAAMVTAMIELARSLGMQVVAEGIETEEQLAFLTERRCPLGQGFLFSRPLPPEQLVLR